LFGEVQFHEIYIECPLDVCRQRDPKGLYRKAREGLIPAFTGVSDPYEPPPAPDLTIRTADLSIDECLNVLLGFTLERCASRPVT
jgi:adenylylsulfate kinase